VKRQDADEAGVPKDRVRANGIGYAQNLVPAGQEDEHGAHSCVRARASEEVAPWTRAPVHVFQYCHDEVRINILVVHGRLVRAEPFQSAGVNFVVHCVDAR
jgi:hypothetical protein